MKRVLIFDSGVGGLSIYQEIYRQLPQVQYVYAFDDAAFPYGELPDSELIERTSHIVTRLVERHQVDLVVIACNTASTIVLPSLREQLSIPVVGVVPAIKPAALASKRKAIGLLATPATITRQYTDILISQFANDCEVLRIGSTRLVEMAEEKLRGKPVSITELREILSAWQGKVDCIVLGCTHFPLIKEEVLLAVGEKVQVIDSGMAIANRVKALLGDVVVHQQVFSNFTYNSAAGENAAALNISLEQLGLSAIESLNYPRSLVR
ncbi:glutamate racemase [Photobacterium sanctipauli]|uniref:Glutamate racemase n=1 Tax=Photobacterium sanctipauli TaxID=1342794 RepID=A0A2T3NEZ5_9GAMM|nr:glutamate racemase [Photobacterium sanctipauli]PSW13135.1 glutamate racemase [Photobacterium sanctipauli]